MRNISVSRDEADMVMGCMLRFRGEVAGPWSHDANYTPMDSAVRIGALITVTAIRERNERSCHHMTEDRQLQLEPGEGGMLAQILHWAFSPEQIAEQIDERIDAIAREERLSNESETRDYWVERMKSSSQIALALAQRIAD